MAIEIPIYELHGLSGSEAEVNARVEFAFLQKSLEIFDFKLTKHDEKEGERPGFEVVTLRPPRLSRTFATLPEAQAFFDGVFFYNRMRVVAGGDEI